jgi:hypothetical protein
LARLACLSSTVILVMVLSSPDEFNQREQPVQLVIKSLAQLDAFILQIPARTGGSREKNLLG